MPVLFEVFKWLLFEAGPQAARKGLAKIWTYAVLKIPDKMGLR
jgi:hypothetical protein